MLHFKLFSQYDRWRSLKLWSVNGYLLPPKILEGILRTLGRFHTYPNIFFFSNDVFFRAEFESANSFLKNFYFHRYFLIFLRDPAETGFAATFFILAGSQARSMFFGKNHIFSESSKSKLSYAQRTKLIAWKITEIQAKQSNIIHQKK